MAYPHEKPNTSKAVIRSQELSMCSLEEIKEEPKPQGVTEVKRISLKRDNKIIQTSI